MFSDKIDQLPRVCVEEDKTGQSNKLFKVPPPWLSEPGRLEILVDHSSDNWATNITSRSDTSQTQHLLGPSSLSPSEWCQY